MTLIWTALSPEGVEEYLAGELIPLHVRETPHGVEVATEHDFPANPRVHKICQRCDLLPLDWDALEVPCEPDNEVKAGDTSDCDECGREVTLDEVDEDGTLVGAECSCGYYVSRYLPGKTPR